MKEKMNKHSVALCAVLSMLSYLLPMVKVESEYLDDAMGSNLFRIISDDGLSFGLILLLVLPIAQIVLNYLPSIKFKNYILIAIPAVSLATLIATFAGSSQEILYVESKPGIGVFLAAVFYIAGAVFAVLIMRSHSAAYEQDDWVDDMEEGLEHNKSINTNDVSASVDDNPRDAISGMISNLKARGTAFIHNAQEAGSKPDSSTSDGEQFANTPEKKRIRAEIAGIDTQLSSLYVSIGKKYADAAEKDQQASLSLAEELEIIKNARDRRKALENELIEIDRQQINERITRDRIQAQQQFDAEIDRLNKALSLGVMSDEEYQEKYKALQARMDHFEKIKKLEIQAEMGVITTAERDEKIRAVLKQ